jgi:hypothetical protein
MVMAGLILVSESVSGMCSRDDILLSNSLECGTGLFYITAIYVLLAFTQSACVFWEDTLSSCQSPWLHLCPSSGVHETINLGQ